MSRSNAVPLRAAHAAHAHAALLALLALVLSGCGSVLSIAPVVTDADAEMDPRLFGRWIADDDTEIVVRAGEGNAYAIEYRPLGQDPAGATGEARGGRPARFEGRLGRLGGRRVLDVRPAFTPPEPYDALMVPGHLLFVIDTIDGDRLQALTLQIDSVLAHLRAGDLDLPSTTQPAGWQDDEGEGTPEQLILHGGTPELRAALETYVERPGVFAAPDTLRRVVSGT